MNSIYLPAISALVFILVSHEANAFGKKPVNPEPPVSNPSGGVQAKPFRFVNLARVTTPAFYLPNGQRVDFNTDLNTLIDTDINKSRYIRTQLSTPEHPPRLVMTGGITTFEMNVLQLNLKIGWNPGGAIIPGGMAPISGEVDVSISSLSMDFKIYDRVTGKAYVASFTNEKLSTVNASVKVNLGDIQATLVAIYKSLMETAIRKATADIMTNIENDPKFDLIPWEAKVNGVDREKGMVSFTAGASDGVAMNQIYSVYSFCSAEEKDCFERFLSDVKVSSVGGRTSEAVPATPQDTVQSVQTDDIVYVKPLMQSMKP